MGGGECPRSQQGARGVPEALCFLHLVLYAASLCTAEPGAPRLFEGPTFPPITKTWEEVKSHGPGGSQRVTSFFVRVSFSFCCFPRDKFAPIPVKIRGRDKCPGHQRYSTDVPEVLSLGAVSSGGRGGGAHDPVLSLGLPAPSFHQQRSDPAVGPADQLRVAELFTGSFTPHLRG